MTSRLLDKLLNAIPTDWQMDLTPPQGEWDEERGPLPIDEAMARIWGTFTGPFTQIIHQLGEVFNRQPFLHEYAEYTKAITAASSIHSHLEKADNEAHGCHENHIHASAKRKDQSLPRRRSNSGPAWNPHGRGGRGSLR